MTIWHALRMKNRVSPTLHPTRAMLTIASIILVVLFLAAYGLNELRQE